MPRIWSSCIRGNICMRAAAEPGIFQEKTAPDIRKKLGLEEKRIYCYLPTWRGAEKAGQTQEARLRQAERIREILGTLDAGLGENEVLYVRLHPFVGQILSFEGFSHVKPAPQKLDIYELWRRPTALSPIIPAYFTIMRIKRRKSDLLSV